ncbi:MAG: hypothetical protein EOP04_10170 [Proteobacteria bacterium]|nr:MAG: hypothetical protein EOP04_10170 [Pseudomonadota bacterium]
MNKMIIVSLLLSATSAFAKSNTEYYFQPAAGAHAIEANYFMDIKPAKTATGTAPDVDAKNEINDLQLMYMYGLNENNAIGLSTFTGTNKSTVGATSKSASGMGDLVANYRGFMGMWHYGADLGVNLEKIKLDSAGDVSNRASGGMSVRANVGMLMASDAWNYGGDLSYSCLLSVKSTTLLVPKSLEAALRRFLHSLSTTGEWVSWVLSFHT